MAPGRPPWVIRDLSSILGLDEESISQLLLPEFEAYTSQVKLKSHLQVGFPAVHPCLPPQSVLSRMTRRFRKTCTTRTTRFCPQSLRPVLKPTEL
ncbi:hypothetical protein EHS25_009554 [Saitozyma podzolica]|uniref:Uncharacterized protein n=1 Tax=Saitozyma podzolica TaxID=1890683 RepID=A0A427YJI1_9TREE|nr:hypothetical protein EHS25_009554 [Saitozyma podzolica]